MSVHQILDFWIGPLNDLGLAQEHKQELWFRSSKEFDQQIADNFGTLLNDIENGTHRDWLHEVASALAYVIILDQFSRNIHRGSPEAFANDAMAVEATLAVLDRASELPTHQRFFLYMPLMHSEQLTHHEQLEFILTRELEEAMDSEVVSFWKMAIKSAVDHKNIIEKFSRYPHRNLTLGRVSTPEEVRYLEQGANRFGQ